MRPSPPLASARCVVTIQPLNFSTFQLFNLSTHKPTNPSTHKPLTIHTFYMFYTAKPSLRLCASALKKHSGDGRGLLDQTVRLRHPASMTYQQLTRPASGRLRLKVHSRQLSVAGHAGPQAPLARQASPLASAWCVVTLQPFNHSTFQPYQLINPPTHQPTSLPTGCHCRTCSGAVCGVGNSRHFQKLREARLKKCIRANR